MNFDDTTTLPAEGATTTETTSYDRDEVTPEQFHAANLADALTFLLLELGAPIPVRHLLIALQGLLAGRKTVVHFKRVELVARLFKASNGWIDNADLERMKNRVTNHLTIMQDWIHKEGLQGIIDYQSGTKTTDSKIKTSIFQWSVEIANSSERRLLPDSSDKERRKIFIEDARKLVGKRIAKKKMTATRIKREPSPAARWKTAMTLAIQTFDENRAKSFDENRAKFKSTPEEITTFLCNEMRQTLERHYLENPWGENGFDETTLITCSLENSRDEIQKEHRGGQCEPDYSDEVNPFDMRDETEHERIRERVLDWSRTGQEVTR
jgi:hypothetical protein